MRVHEYCKRTEVKFCRVCPAYRYINDQFGIIKACTIKSRKIKDSSIIQEWCPLPEVEVK